MKNNSVVFNLKNALNIASELLEDKDAMIKANKNPQVLENACEEIKKIINFLEKNIDI